MDLNGPITEVAAKSNNVKYEQTADTECHVHHGKPRRWDKRPEIVVRRIHSFPAADISIHIMGINVVPFREGVTQ